MNQLEKGDKVMFYYNKDLYGTITGKHPRFDDLFEVSVPDERDSYFSQTYYLKEQDLRLVRKGGTK
jgi:hypothetical protein